jgi:hypothetical protein
MIEMRLVALAVVLVAAAGCDRFYTVRGTVASCRTGAPVPGAIVHLHYPGERDCGATDEKGAFVVSPNDPPGTQPGTLTVAASGYRTVTRTVHDGEQVNVCLQQESSAP